MYNYIILSSCLFGSVYICSKSLKLINNVLLTENKKMMKPLIILNGTIFIISGSLFIYSIMKSNKNL